MAIFKAGADFDLREIIFTTLYTTSYGAYFNPEATTIDGVDYDSSYVFARTSDETETLEFYGYGITEGEKTYFATGTFTSFYTWFWDSTDEQWYNETSFRGFQLSAVEFGNAMDSDTLADDRALVAKMLAGNDRITLYSGADWFDGKAGRDVLRGNGGNDTLFGGAGADTIYGGAGKDQLDGGLGNDLILGGLGADRIVGGAGADTLTGNAGADVFVLKVGGGLDTVTDFADGLDHLRFSNGATAFSQLTITDTGADVRVSFGSEAFLLRGIEPGVLSSADFFFG